MSQLFSGETEPRLFEPLDRAQVVMPVNYLKGASCVLFAGEATLKEVGHVPGRQRPPLWVRGKPGVYVKRVRNHVLRVRQSGSWRSDHWAIERYDIWEEGPLEALAFPFGSMPLWARSYQAAMRIAEHCHFEPRPSVAAGWMRAY